LRTRTLLKSLFVTGRTIACSCSTLKALSFAKSKTFSTRWRWKWIRRVWFSFLIKFRDFQWSPQMEAWLGGADRLFMADTGCVWIVQVTFISRNYVKTE